MKTSFRSTLTILFLPALFVRAAIFTTDTTIDFKNGNFDGDTLTVSNCTLTVNGPHTFAGVNIGSGGKLTHQASDSGWFYTGFQTNELIVLTGTSSVPLSQTNVQNLSVTVSDLSGSIVYTNGADYALTNSGGVTSIQRTDTSAIADGASVSVSYGGTILLGPSGLKLTITGDLLLESGGAIDVAGRGYNQGFGTGKGGAAGSSATCSGGGYGGVGGISASNAPGGNAYGDWLQPTDKGSEGGALQGPGGSGGGAVYITVGGLLRVNGTVSANGANALNERTGGGSGGSIWLTAQSFTGSGSISANGGDGEPVLAGGGGGGRIAIYSQNNSFAGAVAARGGRGFQMGGAGTIYVQTGSLGSAMVDNGGRSGAPTPLTTTQAVALTVKSGAIVSLPSQKTVSTLLLASNGWFTMSRSSLTVLGDVTIQRDSGITADGAGYLSGSGPGAGRVISGIYAMGGGGGYGGSGATGGTNAFGGGCYGFLQQPTDPGSGGGSGGGTYPYTLGGAGGGAIFLNVSGTLVLNGTISANGAPGIGQDSGGGSGGSVWLNVGGFSGSGTISASGGLGNDLGGSGGGGRIAVYYQISDFSGVIQARGGGFSPNVAGAGSIYIKPAGQPAGNVLFDNGGQLATVPSYFFVQEPVALTIQGGAVGAPTSSLNLGTLLINANSLLRFSNLVQSVIVSGDATINPGGAITADAGAVSPGTGAGRSFTILIPGGPTAYYGGGGGYGGYGGYGSPSTGGSTYGSAGSPGELGSSGGSALSIPGGVGGGALRLTVNGSLNNNGRISSEGAAARGANAGGGSGGSISLTVGNLTGAGLISVNGGAGNGLGGGGGGGRIAVTYANSYFTGTMSAYGASGGANGGPGTIFLRANNQSIGQVVIDNGGVPGLSPGASTVGSATSDLTIRGGAIVSNYFSNLSPINNLVIATNSWLLFNGSSTAIVNVSGNATIQAGGGIRNDGGVPPATGQGAGRTYFLGSTNAGSGGGYGGYGGSALGGAGGSGYGSATFAPSVGSGGGNANLANSGGAGGGALTLRVTGTLTLDGRVSADGNSAGPGANGGGGSGGSVYITAATLFGVGTISASGGNGDGYGGGGGGGRILIQPTVNVFLGNALAYGGNGASRGGAGTIYVSVGQNTGQLIVDNGGVPGTNTYISDSNTFDLTVRGGASALFYSSSATVRDLSVGSNSWVVFNGYPNLSATLVISGNASVDSGGGIRADASGYPAGSGPGAGRSLITSTNTVGSGGAYGGYGGAAALGILGGNAYGLSTNAPQAGSGGGGSDQSVTRGGAGGGSLTIRITGSLALDGRISVNGGSAVSGNGGGGAGGSIFLTSAALFGSGSIAANGGDALRLGGGGGGGRIMLFPGINVFAGSVTAFGGNGFNRGGAGTVYTYSSPAVGLPGVGQVVVDNAGLPGTNTLISDLGPFDLTVRAGGKAFLSSLASIRNLYVASNAWFFVPTNPGTLNITGNAVIENGGTILADGLGYPYAQGPGAGANFNNVGGGAGYGGYGGANGIQFGGNAYGSLSAPNQLGSGGGGGGTLAPFGGPGGGAIILNVIGILDVEGRISANGLPGSGNSGGGSGGSIWLTAGTLLGPGTISASGGDGAGLGGGGGGGRISLNYTANSFTGQAIAYGGNGSVGGGAGTIYLGSRQLSNPQVIVDNGGHSGTNTSIAAVPSSADLIIRNGGAALADRGVLACRNLVIQSNGWLKAAASPASSSGQFTVSGNATIAFGGGILLDAAGFAQGIGSGAGRSGTSNLGTAGGGGGYGGSGGASGTGGAGGATYASPFSPSGVGSGGANTPLPSMGGVGGGGLALNVIGTLQLDGRISANGGPGVPPGGGGGSGGTLGITAGRLAGAGVISANGGNGDGLGGGGGGGRIRVGYSTSTFTGLMSAYGGAGANWGGAGTIYVVPATQPAGRLIVDNGGHSGTNTPFSTTVALTSPFADLTIQNGATVSMGNPQSYWSNLVVNPGGVLTAPAGLSNLNLSIFHNARIEAGGAMLFDGLGFRKSAGPGAGLFSNFTGSGAGYGGVGGASSQAPGGPTYGSAQQPTDFGSGGGIGWTSSGPGSEGGGAVHLTVSGTLTVNGQLTADGNAALQEDAGGGSGGSIWIEASTFTGGGFLAADGGLGELFEGGGGGGGRIAIYSRTNYFTGQLSASGGAGYNPGQDGSIYLSSTMAPPAVTAYSPSGLVTNAVLFVDLYFNKTLNPLTLTDTNFALIPPAGTLPPMTIGRLLPSPSHVTMQFDPPLTGVGTYKVVVGPGIQDLFGQPMSQVFTGSFNISLPVIQGRIADMAGNPVVGAVLQPAVGMSPAVTDTNGSYALGVPYGFDVTVTPSAGNWTMVPGLRSYTNVVASISNEDYLAVSTIVPTISSRLDPTNLSLSWFGIAGVTYQPLVSTNLMDWVPYGPPLAGTNGNMQFVIPMDGSPQNYFRLRANN